MQTWRKVPPYWKQDAWHKFTLATLALLSLIGTVITCAALGCSEQASLWGSSVLSLIIVWGGFWWQARRKTPLSGAAPGAPRSQPGAPGAP